MRFLHAREIAHAEGNADAEDKAHAEDNAHAKDNMHAEEMMHAEGKVELVNDACRMIMKKHACNFSSHANRPCMSHRVAKTGDNKMGR